MSDTVNPYQSPVDPAPVKLQEAAAGLTETMLRYLREASPWLRFIGIIGFISSGLTALMGLIFMGMMTTLESFWNDIPDLPDFLARGIGGAFGFIYIIIAALAFFPAFFTFNFGAKIRNYQRSGADQDLEAAFKNNKSLWKFSGILAIVGLAFIPLSIVGLIIAGIASAF
ncbi:MAG: DUF5362 family protein [Spirochaetales bacterium]|jgi:hypothetical protein|nr:DUF5362 family protein [Spirochaetales bacterium]